MFLIVCIIPFCRIMTLKLPGLPSVTIGSGAACGCGQDGGSSSQPRCKWNMIDQRWPFPVSRACLSAEKLQPVLRISLRGPQQILSRITSLILILFPTIGGFKCQLEVQTFVKHIDFRAQLRNYSTYFIDQTNVLGVLSVR